MDETNNLLLIVEDHEGTRKALTGLLRRDGWDVIAASTVAEGLRLLGAKPRCVILDLILPDGDGEVVLKRIKESGLACHVVVCSGEGNRNRLVNVRRLAPDAILQKPFEFKTLLQACHMTA
jgi:DNA-binding response OmpR family regulator